VKQKTVLVRKFFQRDKNYILEKAQLSVENSLLTYLVDFVKVEYLLRTNPLGIADATSERVHRHNGSEYLHLHEFYLILAGVFRLKFYEDNQLAFNFGGGDDSERYREEWQTVFKQWVKELCRHENFIRAVLELTVFYPEDYTPQMAGLRLSTFITKFFDVKIDGQKGLIKHKVA
jgi:hypothetical protein